MGIVPKTRGVDRGDLRGKWFNSGDLVIRGEDALLYSHGGADELLKMCGVRAHHAEVEAKSNTHSAVPTPPANGSGAARLLPLAG
ncbi:hypothetical protein [Mycolicibacterium pyrenivorans]|uniref:hypothetical protein n=1 Tax=Mycolicibacterium pyrenivorans TaxID=187102 RepID=UPI0021F26591|nr:hypothetical protein [Mycolicibacterium pyrenivorans]MCV7152312.1 hypothetical protein [Mycolicibacterium pyrenivorans]